MIKKVEHTAIIVKNMDDTLAFYSSIFGFKLRMRGSNAKREMAFIYHGVYPDFEIELIRDLIPGQEYSVNGVVNHIAFAVDDIEESIKYYSSKGVIFKSASPNIAIDGRKTIFFEGPNSELLQLVEQTN